MSVVPIGGQQESEVPGESLERKVINMLLDMVSDSTFSPRPNFSLGGRFTSAAPARVRGPLLVTARVLSLVTSLLCDVLAAPKSASRAQSLNASFSSSCSILVAPHRKRYDSRQLDTCSSFSLPGLELGSWGPPALRGTPSKANSVLLQEFLVVVFLATWDM